MTGNSTDGRAQFFEDATADQLKGDIKKATAPSDLAGAVASEITQRNTQRGILFWAVIVLVGVGFVALLALVALLGFGCMALPTGAAVAAISAVGIQPFVLIGILTRGLYQGAPKQSGD